MPSPWQMLAAAAPSCPWPCPPWRLDLTAPLSRQSWLPSASASREIISCHLKFHRPGHAVAHHPDQRQASAVANQPFVGAGQNRIRQGGVAFQAGGLSDRAGGSRQRVTAAGGGQEVDTSVQGAGA